jgi:hypothetical protein
MFHGGTKQLRPSREPLPKVAGAVDGQGQRSRESNILMHSQGIHYDYALRQLVYTRNATPH